MFGTRLNRRAMLGVAGASTLLPLAASATSSLKPSEEAASWQSQKKFANVHGQKMAYHEAGSGRPIVFLHGNPTSSYLWRNIIPHVAHLGRCIAPDLIGMGDSAKLPNAGAGTYTFETHQKYLYELLRTLGADRDITFVIHDWGSGLGFNYAAQNPEKVRGIAYAEAILTVPDAAPRKATGGLFDTLQTADGAHLVLEQNIFVERLLIGGLKYFLTPEDEAEYRRPYLEPGASRWPTLEWPRELPNYSAKNKVAVDAYSKWLSTSKDTPKLFMRALPGAIMSRPELLKFVQAFPNQKEVTVFGSHYLQEVSPDAMGRALAEWIPTLA